MHEEYIDVCTEDGTPTGEVKTRKEVHEKGLWHHSVHVWFVNSSKEVLLQQRSFDKESYPGMWDISAAGHMSAGDEPIAAAVRETKEEIGVTIAPTELVHIGTYKHMATLNNGTYICNGIKEVYVVHKDLPVDAFSFDDGEVAKVLWIPVADLEARVESGDSTIVECLEEHRMLFSYVNR